MGHPSGEQFEIALGRQKAVVVEVGGGLRTYSVGDRDVLDGYAVDEPATSGRGQVLIPWPNRIRDGTYEFDGRRHQLELNEPERGNAIHGLVRNAPWRATEHDGSRVVVEHVLDEQTGYPFSLGLRIEYALSEAGLSVTTTATNLGAERCPYGCGAHPYLTVGTPTVDTASLSVPAETVLLIRMSAESRPGRFRSGKRTSTSASRQPLGRPCSTTASRISSAMRTAAPPFDSRTPAGTA